MFSSLLPVLGISPTGNILIWVGALMGVILLGGIVSLWLRRRYREDVGMAGSLESLSLQQLRELRDSGQLSQDEFEALKAAAVKAHGGAAGAGRPAKKVAAERGFDLTGEPLPGSGGSDENQNGRETPGGDGA